MAAAPKPSDYSRRSERFSAASMPPGVRAELEEFAAKAGAEIDISAARAGVRTLSEARGKGGFLRRRPPDFETLALLTDRHLVIVVLREGEQINSIYRLDSIDVAVFDSPLIADVGLEISGTMVGGTEPHRAFLAVDESPAGNEFRERLRDAARPAAR